MHKHLLIALSLMIALSPALASAHDGEHPTTLPAHPEAPQLVPSGENNPWVQVAGGVGGGLLLGFAGGYGGLLLGQVTCQADDLSCLNSMAYGLFAGSLLAGTIGAAGGTLLTGGSKATQETINAGLMGGLQGALIATGLGVGAGLVSAGFGQSDITSLQLGVLVGGLSGLVAIPVSTALAYDAAYPGIENVTLTPTFREDGGGFALGFQF